MRQNERMSVQYATPSTVHKVTVKLHYNGNALIELPPHPQAIAIISHMTLLNFQQVKGDERMPLLQKTVARPSSVETDRPDWDKERQEAMWKKERGQTPHRSWQMEVVLNVDDRRFCKGGRDQGWDRTYICGSGPRWCGGTGSFG